MNKVFILKNLFRLIRWKAWVWNLSYMVPLLTFVLFCSNCDVYLVHYKIKFERKKLLSGAWGLYKQYGWERARNHSFFNIYSSRQIKLHAPKARYTWEFSLPKDSWEVDRIQRNGGNASSILIRRHLINPIGHQWWWICWIRATSQVARNGLQARAERPENARKAWDVHTGRHSQADLIMNSFYSYFWFKYKLFTEKRNERTK